MTVRGPLSNTGSVPSTCPPLYSSMCPPSHQDEFSKMEAERYLRVSLWGGSPEVAMTPRSQRIKGGDKGWLERHGVSDWVKLLLRSDWLTVIK